MIEPSKGCKLKCLVLCLLLLGLIVSLADAQSTIFMVRHAEKAESASDDPDLSGAGRARAEALTKMLKDVGIAAIYATEFKRTQQTAAPLAKVLGLEVAIVPGKETTTLSTKLRNLHADALVVGHSNTIPELIKALGVATSITISDTDYDNLFLVVLSEKPRLIRLHYP
jgi:broad specificity phosphatase PhoE